MKTVWIINQYASTPATGIGGRHHYLARELARLGHRVFLIGAGWHHLLQENETTAKALASEQIEGYTFVRVPVPRYATAHGKGRIRNWFLFRHRIWALRKTLPRPDTILYSSPALVPFGGAARLARHFNARLLFEVRDIWPLTLTELGGAAARHPFIRYMQRIENGAYRTCDAALSNLSHAEDHMLAHGLKPGRFTCVPNGISAAEVASPVPLDTETTNALPKQKFIIGYTGTLGLANKMNVLIDTAALLKDHTDIAFVLVGGGKDKAGLVQQAADLGLDNVTFIDPISKQQVQSMIAHFDLCFLGTSKSPLYRFGLAANKIYDYMYASRPLLLSYSGAGDPATKYDAGLCVPAEDPDALAEAILALKSLPQTERDAMGKRARDAVLTHHEFGALAIKLEGLLFPDLVTKGAEP
ncbi:glycosyltransferase family 4 protein [Sulfitobacter pacificus]|uniref:glycosyltransferase family 4 protein n=1 Tax=Sulfitobacter pacificus TaxID=1499314 RepID=UPI0031087C45